MEFGGYFQLDTYTGKEYHSDALALNSGRHCLEYLLLARDIKKILIPYYICDSIIETLQKNNVTFSFYHIDKSFQPILNGAISKDTYLYIVNYFGQLSPNYIIELSNKYKIILDNAQSFFTMPLPNIDTLYTCRKFFGVSDGGYLYTTSKLNLNLDDDYSYERIHFVLGRFEKDARTFFAEASNNNDIFKNENLKNMSKLTHNLLKAIDYDMIFKKRTDNFNYLWGSLQPINQLDIIKVEGAFMYPLLLSNGEKLKTTLISKNIFVPTLWKDALSHNGINSFEQNLVNNLIILPCDQRYSLDEMAIITKQLLDII